MDFEAVKISKSNYQLFIVKDDRRLWLASFNKLNTLLDYYIFCHNLSDDRIMFTGMKMDDKESLLLNELKGEWNIEIMI